MGRTRFRTIWISDTHLGTRGCQARALLDFLEAHECDYLYLVGDIIDFWRLGRAPHWPQLHSDVIRTVLSKTRAGTVVTLAAAASYASPTGASPPTSRAGSSAR